MKNEGIIIVISGPSGSGKTSLGEILKRKGIPESVSNTTRKMRPGEVDGVSYYFTKEEDFDKIVKIEYSNYSGNKYCLSKDEVERHLDTTGVTFAITDIHGYKQVKEKYGDQVISIFLEVTYDEMIKRMEFRGDSKENISKRIQYAIMNDELSGGKDYDYVIRNDVFGQTVFEVEKILEKEGIKVKTIA